MTDKVCPCCHRLFTPTKGRYTRCKDCRTFCSRKVMTRYIHTTDEQLTRTCDRVFSGYGIGGFPYYKCATHGGNWYDKDRGCPAFKVMEDK